MWKKAVRWIALLVAALLVAGLVRLCWVTLVEIPGDGGRPVFLPGDRVALTALWLWRYVPVCVRALRKKRPPDDLAASILLLGFFLTGLLRMAAIAYLMAVVLSFDIYLMYLSAACAPMLAFLAFGAAKWAEAHRPLT